MLQTIRPYLAGQDATQGVTVKDGAAIITALKSVCYPEGQVELEFEMDPQPLKDIITDSMTSATSKAINNKVSSQANAITNSYVVTKMLTMTFRPCVAGEYVFNGACTRCANGTYNLEWNKNTTSCQSCQAMTGVEECVGNQLKLSKGYWRRQKTSAEVLPCLLGDISCPGGIGVGDDACWGYQGPFCAQCQDGYYISERRCLSCGSTSFTPVKIVSMIVLCLIIIIAIGLLIA